MVFFPPPVAASDSGILALLLVVRGAFLAPAIGISEDEIETEKTKNLEGE